MAQIKLPSGVLGLIVSSTNEAQQEDLFFPCDPRLFAVNVNGDPECGSLVFDLNGANEPDSARGAYLQSAFRVVKLPLGLPNAIAFQLDSTGKKDTQGGFFCEVMQAPAMEMPSQDSGGDKSVGTVAFDSGLAGAQVNLDGPGKTVVAGEAPPPAGGGFGFGEGSHNYGGPFHVGVKDDKHFHGKDADGNPINALHLWTSANFFMNRVADGPIRFELEYKEGDEHDHVVPVHIAWSGADWAAWTTSPFYEPPPPEEDPQKPRRPFGGTIFNGNNPRFDPLRPTIPNENVDGGRFADPIPPYTIFNDNNPTFGPPVDGRVSGSGIPMNLVASLSAVMSPGLVMRPENYNTAVQSTGLFDSGSPQGGSNSDRQESAAANRAKADSSSPVTAMASAFGAQGGFVDAGGSGSGTTHGSEGDPWLYTQVPRGAKESGKRTSIYPGGTASGGVIYHPPETDLRDLADYGMVPPEVTLSETRVMCAPGASFGVGIPDLATGGIKTGANWAYDSDTGDMVFHTYSFTTESEAIRVTNPTQLIRWMSGQSYYGEFSHTNTTNQTWTFPDVTATIAAMVFTVAAPSSTAPEGTFAWDVSANNLYVNNDGATSWTFVGGASSVTGSGANTRLAYWTSATVLSSDAGLTYDATNDILSVTNSSANTNPQLILTQSSTGDSATRWAIGSTASFIAGIDNSDSDSWKLSYAASGSAVLGTNDFVKVDTSGATYLTNTAGKQLRLGYDASLYVDLTVFATGSMQIQPSHNGLDHLAVIYNKDATATFALAQQNAGASAALSLTLAGSGSGDTLISLNRGSATYYIGVDTSDSDAFKLSQTSLGFTDLWRTDSSGTAFNGYVRVSTATDAAAAGDFSSGLTGAARLFYDQSVPILYLYNSSGTIVTQFSAVAATATVHNEQQADIDFRIEGDNTSHLFFLDASVDFIGINTSAPDRRLDILDASNPQLRLTHTDGSVYVEMQAGSSGNLSFVSSNGANARLVEESSIVKSFDISSETTGDAVRMRFYDGLYGTERGRLTYAGENGAGSRYFGFVNVNSDYFGIFSDTINIFRSNGASRYINCSVAAGVVINEDSHVDFDLRVEGDNTTHLLFVDSSADKIGINQSTVASRLHITESTVGNEVLRVESVATNDDPSDRFFHGRAATTDATVTTINTIAVAASTTVMIEAHVRARRTGGTSGTAEDAAGYVIYGTYKNVAGTATLVGAVAADYTAEDQAGWDATLTASGGNVLLRVTGASNNNVTWHSTVRVMQVGS